MKAMGRKLSVTKIVLVGIAGIIFIIGILDNAGIINIFTTTDAYGGFSHYQIPLMSVVAVSIVLDGVQGRRNFVLLCCFIVVSTIVFIVGIFALFVDIGMNWLNALNFTSILLMIVSGLVCLYSGVKIKKEEKH
jgi:hypothetical protein